MTADREELAGSLTEARRATEIARVATEVRQAFSKLEALAYGAIKIESEIDKLARYILEKVEGEPSQNESAVDTALRVLEALRQSLDTALATVEKQSATIVGVKRFLHELAQDAERGLQDRGVPPLATTLQRLRAQIEARLANFRFDGVGDYYPEPACGNCGSAIAGVHSPDCPACGWCSSCGWIFGHRLGCPHAEAEAQSPARPWYHPALKATHAAIVNKARDPWAIIGNAMVQCWEQEDARAAAAPARTPTNQCSFLFSHSPPYTAFEPRVRCSCKNIFMRIVALRHGLYDAKCTCGVHLTLREIPLESGVHTRSVRCEPCSSKYLPGSKKMPDAMMMSYDADRGLWTCRRDDGCGAAICWEVPQ